MRNTHRHNGGESVARECLLVVVHHGVVVVGHAQGVDDLARIFLEVAQHPGPNIGFEDVHKLIPIGARVFVEEAEGMHQLMGDDALVKVARIWKGRNLGQNSCHQKKQLVKPRENPIKNRFRIRKTAFKVNKSLKIPTEIRKNHYQY